MLDAYGIAQDTLAMQQYRITSARSSYEASCLKKGVSADWDRLDATDRHLWLMTADAMMTLRLRLVDAAAC